MLPEALPTPRDLLPDDSHSRPTSFVDGERRHPEPVLGPDVDAFAVEWQLVTGASPAG